MSPGDLQANLVMDVFFLTISAFSLAWNLAEEERPNWWTVLFIINIMLWLFNFGIDVSGLGQYTLTPPEK